MEKLELIDKMLKYKFEDDKTIDLTAYTRCLFDMYEVLNDKPFLNVVNIQSNDELDELSDIFGTVVVLE